METSAPSTGLRCRYKGFFPNLSSTVSFANSNLTGLDLPMIAEESWVNIDWTMTLVTHQIMTTYLTS